MRDAVATGGSAIAARAFAPSAVHHHAFPPATDIAAAAASVATSLPRHENDVDLHPQPLFPVKLSVRLPQKASDLIAGLKDDTSFRLSLSMF